jgi:phosphatidylserine/phosphatidylglycerophosphate/cardiolipin synthase-like enzyme
LIVADSGNHKLKTVDPASGAVGQLSVNSIDGSATALGEVFGLALDPASGPDGALFVSEPDRHRVLKLDLNTGLATTVAGSQTGVAGYQDGAAAGSLLNRPLGLAFENDVLFIADAENRVLRAVDLVPGNVRTIGSRTSPGPQDLPVVAADVLRRKAAEGVTVRILLDGYGSGIERDAPLSWEIDGPQTEADLRFYHANIQAAVQNHPQTIPFLGKPAASFHEKMMVIDGKVGTAGGIDFASDKNDGLQHDRKHLSLFWHDVIALAEGKVAFGLEEHFARRWTMARDERSHLAALPQLATFTPVDRTDAAIADSVAECVRTFDPTPLVGFLVNLRNDATQEILDSYKRAILAARYYVYMEHQYIYYPEIGNFIEQAMTDNPGLQVIWTIPFFTEEATDPTQERAKLVREHKLASAITDASQMVAGNQLRSQLAWNGFFRLKEMIEKFRKVDPRRFGLFSIRRLFKTSAATDPTLQMIYPHSKMILCDDRFFSIGSANANGRGFTKDGEINISTPSAQASKALRERLWGEHLGYLGVGVAQPDGTLLSVNGHHLSHDDVIRIQHPGFGEVDRKVDAVDPATGSMTLLGAPLDPALGRILWRDPRLADLPLASAMEFWRKSAHSLNTYRAVEGVHASTNAGGDLVVAGNVAKAGYKIVFGDRLLTLNDDGRSNKSQPITQPLAAAILEVDSVSGPAIKVKPGATIVQPDVEPIRSTPVGSTVNVLPFACQVAARTGGRAQLKILGLMPNLKDLAFDYSASWVADQKGGQRLVRAWEIDAPDGIKYAGPGTILFSSWLLFPWLFIDFDPDEQSRLDVPGDTRIV